MSAFIRVIGQYDFLAEFEPGVSIYSTTCCTR